MLYTISANRLTNGNVIYLKDDEPILWTEDIAESLVLSTKGDAETALVKSSQDHMSIGAYIISISEKDKSPSLYREILRTKGPSVRKDLGLQSKKIP